MPCSVHRPLPDGGFSLSHKKWSVCWPGKSWAGRGFRISCRSLRNNVRAPFRNESSLSVFTVNWDNWKKEAAYYHSTESRKCLICIWAQAFSICYLSGVPICKCGMWQFSHPKSLNTASCFTERSEWRRVSETLDMIKASDLLLQEGSFGSVWPFIVASWDTLRCCHEMTLPGVAG